MQLEVHFKKSGKFTYHWYRAIIQLALFLQNRLFGAESIFIHSLVVAKDGGSRIHIAKVAEFGPLVSRRNVSVKIHQEPLTDILVNF